MNNNTVTKVSQHFADMTEYTIEELLNRNISDFLNLLRVGPNFDIEDIEENTDYFLFTKSLEVRFVDIEVKNESGEKVYFFSEKANSRLEEKLIFEEHIFLSDKICALIVNAPDLIVLKANQKFLDILDSPFNIKENTIGRKMCEIAPGFIGSEPEALWNSVLKTQKACYKSEGRFDKFARGVTFWDTAKIPAFENGKMKYIFETSTDVTERVINREKIHEQNELLKRQANLLNLSNEAILAKELDGGIIYWNKGAERKYGYSSMEVIGLVVHDLLKTKFPCRLIDVMSTLEKTGYWEGEIEHISKSGQKLIFESKQQVIVDGLGKQIVLETNRDITVRKKAESELQHQKEINRMKDEFLSLISHEFKTPINVIYSAIQAMELVCKDELTDKSKRFLSKIKLNSLRQLRLVNNLLDITRVNEGYFKTDIRNYDIVLITKKIIESIYTYSQQKGVKLSFSSTSKKKIIGLDEEKYERILLNLLSNAIKFTPEGNRVLVMILSKNNHVFIKIKDEGIGIPKDKQELIFERFGQVDSSLSRQAEGSGIGLSLVKQYLELLGGSISVESKVNKGSTFTVKLPATTVDESKLEENVRELTDDRLIQSIATEFSDFYQ